MTPHQLELRGFALEPEAEIVQILVKCRAWSAGRARGTQACHGPLTYMLGVPVSAMPHRIVGELVIEIKGESRFPSGNLCLSLQMRDDSAGTGGTGGIGAFDTTSQGSVPVAVSTHDE